MLNRRPSDALLLVGAVPAIALVLLAVMALQQMVVGLHVTSGSLGAVRTVELLA